MDPYKLNLSNIQIEDEIIKLKKNHLLFSHEQGLEHGVHVASVAQIDEADKARLRSVGDTRVDEAGIRAGTIVLLAGRGGGDV